MTRRPTTRRNRQAPQREKGTASSSTAETGSRAAAQERASRRGQQVRRRRDRGAGAERVGLDLEPPPGGDVGGAGESPAGRGVEHAAGTDEGHDDEHGSTSAIGLVRKRDQACVLDGACRPRSGPVTVLVRACSAGRVRRALGDVLGLGWSRRHQVAQEVQTVGGRQPPRRQQVRDRSSTARSVDA